MGPQIRPLEFSGAQENSVSGLVGLSGWGRNVAGVLLENCGAAIVVNAGILDNTTPFGWNECDYWNGRLGSGGGARKCQARKGTRQDGRVGRTRAAGGQIVALPLGDPDLGRTPKTLSTVVSSSYGGVIMRDIMGARLRISDNAVNTFCTGPGPR